MEFLEYLAEKIEQNVSYAIALPLSVELHKFEKEHQDLTKPRIFIKEHDRVGFTVGFNVNKMYANIFGEKISDLMKEFPENGLERTDELLKLTESDENMYNNIEIMLIMDKIEGDIYNSFRKKDKELSENLPLVIARQYNEIGIPVAYGFNSRVFSKNDIDVSGGKIKIKIRSLEEIELTNIDELFIKLISG